MNEYCMIETASDSKEIMESIAKSLLNKKIAASCHIIESESSWNWHNERESAKEYLLQIKTKKNYQKEIYEIIKTIHNYECFEFAVYDFSSINNDYLDWIESEINN